MCYPNSMLKFYYSYAGCIKWRSSDGRSTESGLTKPFRISREPKSLHAHLVLKRLSERLTLCWFRILGYGLLWSQKLALMTWYGWRSSVMVSHPSPSLLSLLQFRDLLGATWDSLVLWGIYYCPFSSGLQVAGKHAGVRVSFFLNDVLHVGWSSDHFINTYCDVFRRVFCARVWRSPAQSNRVPKCAVLLATSQRQGPQWDPSIPGNASDSRQAPTLPCAPPKIV